MGREGRLLRRSPAKSESSIEHWRERRSASGVTPAIDVETYRTIDEALMAASDRELLVIDCFGRASRATLEIAKKVQLVVQPTGPGLDDLHPGALLFHELANTGIPEARLVFALCRVWTQEEEARARTYLQKAGYDILPGSLPEKPAYRSAQNVGRAITETNEPALNERASAMLAVLLERIKAGSQSLNPRLRRV